MKRNNYISAILGNLENYERLTLDKFCKEHNLDPKAIGMYAQKAGLTKQKLSDNEYVKRLKALIKVYYLILSDSYVVCDNRKVFILKGLCERRGLIYKEMAFLLGFQEKECMRDYTGFKCKECGSEDGKNQDNGGFGSVDGKCKICGAE